MSRGSSLRRPPGIRKERGTQQGASRTTPSPAVKASRIRFVVEGAIVYVFAFRKIACRADSGVDWPEANSVEFTSNHRRLNMALRINDTAPDFTAETTQGTINFHEWI